MHELGLIEQILNIACQKALSNGLDRIDKITLQLGKRSGILPEALELGFAISSKETIAAGASLEIQWFDDEKELTLVSIEGSGAEPVESTRL